MRGNKKVIAHLNEALKAELIAINQYFLHAEMQENWGYKRLSDFTKNNSIGEMKHAEQAIERILYLEGVPGMGMSLPLKIGSNVKEQFENDLALEVDAVEKYNAAIKDCVEAGDNGSRDLFMQLLKDEEQHIDYLEAQLNLIKEVGIQAYLAQQIHAE